MASLRMARGRAGAYEILVSHPIAGDIDEATGLCREAPLAHREGLPGFEGRDRFGPFRRSQLARLPSPCHSLRSRPRISRNPSGAFPPGAERAGRCLKFDVAFSRSCSGGWGGARCAVGQWTPRIFREAHHGCNQTDRVVLVASWSDGTPLLVAGDVGGVPRAD